MARITFKGLCNGTITKTGRTSGKEYQVTSFVEVPSLKNFEVFGDLGLVQNFEVREYTLEADIEGLRNVTVIAGGSAKRNEPAK